jgi:hypothetical protein
VKRDPTAIMVGIGKGEQSGVLFPGAIATDKRVEEKIERH